MEPCQVKWIVVRVGALVLRDRVETEAKIRCERYLEYVVT